jgi:hypothetical protein
VSDFSRCTCEIGNGYDVIGPIVALVLGKDPSDHGFGSHVPEPIGV